MRFKKNTIMIFLINMMRDVNMDILTPTLRRKNKIIMTMVTVTAMEVMDMLDMIMRI